MLTAEVVEGVGGLVWLDIATQKKILFFCLKKFSIQLPDDEIPLEQQAGRTVAPVETPMLVNSFKCLKK